MADKSRKSYDLGMRWIEFNPNPRGIRVGDCAVRAIAKALDVSWETAFGLLAKKAFEMADMPSSDAVWGAVLKDHGFVRYAVPNACPECYTARDFCEDRPRGVYILAFGGHVACCEDGNLYDSWDSSDLSPQFYWVDGRRYNGL